MDNLRGQFGEDSEPMGEGPDHDAFEDDTGCEPPPSAIGQDERRMQVRAYNFWAGLLNESKFPSIEDLDAETQPDFGPFSVLLDFTSGIENPGISFLGDQLAVECGTEGPIQQLDDVPSRSLLSRITDHYLQILANQAPIGFEAEFVNQRGATILYRGILLPFSSDDDTIDFIYGVINWKELADQATTEELMLEIDQALESSAADKREALPITDWADHPNDVDEDHEDDDILDLGSLMETSADDGMEIPEPEFSVDKIVPPTSGANEADDEDEGADSLAGSGLDYATYAGEADDADEDEDAEFGGYHTYDDEDFDEEDEEEEESHGGFASLTSIGGGFNKKAALRANPLEDMGSMADDAYAETEQGNPMPTAYDPGNHSHDFEPQEYAAPPLDETTDYSGDADSLPAVYEPTEIVIRELGDDELELADWLASARDMADQAKASEDRSRRALYEAIGRAYDFAIAAAAQPQEFARMVEDAGLTVQDRAPLTPLVKLVFGIDYDKTRIAEYASVLAHARRNGVARGELPDRIGATSGGLKALVAEERRLRRSELGTEPVSRTEPRDALARKLRALEPLAVADLPAEGSEFTVLVARRTESGEIVILGEAAGDLQLVERAAKNILG